MCVIKIFLLPLKVDLFVKPFSIGFKWSGKRPLKMIKYVILFHLKSSFRTQDVNFFSWLFGDVENCAIREIRLNSKFMTSELGKQTIAPNIFKVIKKMKFGKLIECNKKEI